MLTHAKRHDMRGFTLLEALLYIGLAGTVILAASGVLAFITRAEAKIGAVAEVNDEGYFALGTIGQAVRRSRLVLAPAAGARTETIVLDTGDAATTPTAFSVSDGALWVQEGNAAPVQLTSDLVDVTGLEAEGVVPGSPEQGVRVSLVVDRRSERSEFEYERTFITEASPRQ